MNGWIMKNKILASLAVGLFGVAGLEAQNIQSVPEADNVFGFRLLQELAKEQPDKNLFISAYSAATVLQMVANGAAGTTRTEMQSALATSALTPAKVNTGNQTILHTLKNFDSRTTLTTANAIWYRQGFTVKPDFLKVNQDFFSATVAPLDFASPHAPEVINTWVSDQTHGKIQKLADGMIDPKMTALFLVNAVYFKAKWEDPFKPEATRDQPFHPHPDQSVTVPMMSKTGSFTYRRGTGYQAVRLPYQDERLAMYVFLPDTNSSPETLLTQLNGDTWQRVTRPGFAEKEGALKLPRFKMEYDVDLIPALQAFGMKKAFDSVQADFSGIAPQLYISGVRQKTFVEVKEEGTEAAAATAVGVRAAGLPMPPKDRFLMIVDRPFLFLIEEQQTGTILFAGMVHNPTEP